MTADRARLREIRERVARLHYDCSPGGQRDVRWLLAALDEAETLREIANGTIANHLPGVRDDGTIDTSVTMAQALAREALARMGEK